MEAKLEEIGLFRAEQGYQRFVEQGLWMLEHAGQQGAFARDPSCLTLDRGPVRQRCFSLVIDIGGSHTKAGVALRTPEGMQQWRTMFDFDNSALNRPGQGLAIERFAGCLAERVSAAAGSMGFEPRDLEAVGIIWSNALSSARLSHEGAIRGVTGWVSGYGTEKSYRKGEFFIADLYDGFDLGAVFISSMAAAGIRPRAFVIGNDTIFTLKATPGADAGMVASTGANATDTDDDGYIYNTEIGGLYEMPQDLLSEGDRVLLRDHATGRRAVKLEDLIAGRWLPRIFEGQLLALAEAGEPSLGPLAHLLCESKGGKGAMFHGKDLTSLLKGEALQGECEVFQPAAEVLRQTAHALVRRAGTLAAGMAYFALYHRLERKGGGVLSLDSTQARHLPGYLQAMETQLQALAGEKKVMAALQKPDAEITVPMRGLVEALAGELADA